MTDSSFALQELEVVRVEPAGEGLRSCLDAASLMTETEGMIVGSTRAGGILLCAETYIDSSSSPRPFRVNGGSVESRIWLSATDSMPFPSLSTGDHVTCVDANGETRSLLLGRQKIERRPLISVEAVAPDGGRVTALLQDHWHARIMRQDDQPISVPDVKAGDVVLGYAPG